MHTMTLKRWNDFQIKVLYFDDYNRYPNPKTYNSI